MTVRAFHPVADAFPLMTGKEFDDLVEDVRTHGLREPIWLHRDGRILDGRNRYRACSEAGVDPEYHYYIGPDSALPALVISLNLHRRHLNESQRAVVADRLATMPQGARTDLQQICGMSQGDAANLLSVSTRSVETARKVNNAGSQQLIASVDAGDIAVSDAASVADLPPEEQDILLGRVQAGEAKNLKAARRKADIQKQRKEIEAGTIKLPVRMS